jgi:hypothetical protein
MKRGHLRSSITIHENFAGAASERDSRRRVAKTVVY